MPCSFPLRGYRSRRVNPKSGKRAVVFNVLDGFPDMVVEFACGQCVRCRIERSKQWAVRCVHEAQMFGDENSFITLTYDDAHKPADGSLQLSHFQNFMKRLRLCVGMGFQSPVRFFHCGEYGDKFKRPHYHACIFGWSFSDRELWSLRDGVRLYRSGFLEALWTDDKGEPLGFSTVGDVNVQSAAYVARYVLKKITGENSEEHYTVMDSQGNFTKLKPEYVTMSRRPGLGSAWLAKYKDDVYPIDNVILQGKRFNVPKFYDGIFEHEYPSDFLSLKRRRKREALARSADNTPERLAVKHDIAVQAVSKLKRGYEND